MRSVSFLSSVQGRHGQYCAERAGFRVAAVTGLHTAFTWAILWFAD